MNDTNTNNSGSTNAGGRRRSFAYRGRNQTGTTPRGPRPTTPRGPSTHSRTASSNTAPKPAGGSRSGGSNRGGSARKSASRFNNNKRRSTKAPALQHRLSTTDERSPKLPEIMDDDTVRIIPISGVEEIGRNMTVIETKDDLIIFDIGFQFVSEESNAPGINYILPNTQYVEERKHKIRGLVVTHGHLDHIGGIPFVMERIGNPPIYTQYLTSLMIKKRQEEFPHLDPVDIHVVKEGDSFTLGKIKIKTFPVTHSIPDAMGVSVETKHGDIVLTGDIRLTHENGDVVAEERADWEKIGLNNNLALICD